MKECGFCGCFIFGEGVEPFEQGPIVVGGSDGNEFEASEGLVVSFCSEGCAWAWQVESHRLYDITGKEVRRHLIDEHELTPGKPAGKMSRECFDGFRRTAEVFSAFIEGGTQAVKFGDS